MELGMPTASKVTVARWPSWSLADSGPRGRLRREQQRVRTGASPSFSAATMVSTAPAERAGSQVSRSGSRRGADDDPANGDQSPSTNAARYRPRPLPPLPALARLVRPCRIRHGPGQPGAVSRSAASASTGTDIHGRRLNPIGGRELLDALAAYGMPTAAGRGRPAHPARPA